MAWWDRVDWSDPIERDCPLNRGLVGWWMGAPNCYGGTRLQDLLNRNHGTLTNMSPATAWRAGEHGPEVLLDGTNDYIALGGLPASANSVSWSYEFQHTTTPSNGYPNRDYAVHVGDAGANEINYSSVHEGTQIDLTYTSATSTYHQQSGACVADTGRHLVVCVLDWGNDTAAIYLDGVPLPMTLSGMSNNPQQVTTVQSFGRHPGGVEYFNGSIGSLRVWPYRALTGSDARYETDQWRRGFPDALRWLRGRSMVSVPADVPSGNRRRRSLICGRAA